VIGDNLLGVPPTLLPAEPELETALQLGSHEEAAAAYPRSPMVWALLADDAWQRERVLESYAFARVGYHRGLDALRQAGWRGQGPVPWAHEPNRGVLRALYALRRAAEAIGEDDEVLRLTDFLRDADETAVAQIEGEQ
jgi:hypothetical protein